MRYEFTAIVAQDEGWFITHSPEMPCANGQERTKEEALQNLKESIALILEDRREDSLRGVPESAMRETVPPHPTSPTPACSPRPKTCPERSEGSQPGFRVSFFTGEALPSASLGTSL
jgi:predicted RNase H-like HicB family nuclease